MFWPCLGSTIGTDIRSLEAKILYGYFIFLSYGVFIRSSSHMCDRRFLPMFLFRDGSLASIATITPQVIPQHWKISALWGGRNQTLPDQYRSIFIKVNDPSLNRNKGKYHQSQIWDCSLVNTPKYKK